MPGVRVVRTGGHTMHHQIVMIESGGRTAVFAADLIPTTAHVDEAWIMGTTSIQWTRWRSSERSSGRQSTGST